MYFARKKTGVSRFFYLTMAEAGGGGEPGGGGGGIPAASGVCACGVVGGGA